MQYNHIFNLKKARNLSTLIKLLIFGFVKGRFTGTRPVRSALQTAFIGSAAAGAAFAIARWIGG